MTNSYTIKRIASSKLTEHQINSIAELWLQLDDAENQYDEPYGLKMRHTSKDHIHQCFKNGNEVVTVAVSNDGNFLGFARNIPASEYGDVNYICNLLVDKSHRGMGIGRALLQSIVRHNKSKKKMSMLRVSINNQYGMRLYESIGFSAISQTMVLCPCQVNHTDVKAKEGGAK